MPRPHNHTRPAHSFIKPVLLSSLIIGVLVAILLATGDRSRIAGEAGDSFLLRLAAQLERVLGIGSGPFFSQTGGQADGYTKEGGAFALIWTILSGVLRWVRRGFVSVHYVIRVPKLPLHQIERANKPVRSAISGLAGGISLDCNGFV